MSFSATGNFHCNLCGAACVRPAEPLGREDKSCAQCGSTVRLRGLVALLSKELFAANLALPDFPPLLGLRGFGMSDPPMLAQPLAEKFAYTNTFYHQPPTIDITRPDESEWGRYDFIISSEVMEHVPPPVEVSFANLCRLLKPNGVLLLTVPYHINTDPEEHYPELYEYQLASLGGKTVLVNRRRDGVVETFENLCFHGGDGSTLELRVFTDESLRAILQGAGFNDVRIAAESLPEFGIEHKEGWSLPIVARKGAGVQVPVADIARGSAETARRSRALAQQYQALEAEYEQHLEFHKQFVENTERELNQRLVWGQEQERLYQERTLWALSNDKEIEVLREELLRARAELDALLSRDWLKLGKKLGAL